MCEERSRVPAAWPCIAGKPRFSLRPALFSLSGLPLAAGQVHFLSGFGHASRLPYPPPGFVQPFSFLSFCPFVFPQRVVLLGCLSARCCLRVGLLPALRAPAVGSGAGPSGGGVIAGPSLQGLGCRVFCCPPWVNVPFGWITVFQGCDAKSLDGEEAVKETRVFWFPSSFAVAFLSYTVTAVTLQD